jgi:hypothetical protein
MFSVMWSEHCSYKSSTDPPQVASPPPHRGCWWDRARTPGSSTPATALAVALRIESHNHPSATSSPIRAQPPGWAASSATSSRWVPGRSHSWTRSVSVRSTMPRSRAGLPTASCPGVRLRQLGGRSHGRRRNGRVRRDLQGNPLVNVFCASGILPVERLVLGQASGVGNIAVLLGSTPRAATASAACPCWRRPVSATKRDRGHQASLRCRSAIRSRRSA